MMDWRRQGPDSEGWWVHLDKAGNRGRTKGEVVGWLRTAAPIGDDELAVVFGPQWDAVVALVRRAAVMTGADADVVRDAASDATSGAAAVAAQIS